MSVKRLTNKISNIYYNNLSPFWSVYAKETRNLKGALRWHHTLNINRDYAKFVVQWITDNIVKDSTIVELGTGTGQNLAWLSMNGFKDLVGYDIDESVIEIGKRAINKLRLGNITLIVSDIKMLSRIPECKVLMPLNWTYQHSWAFTKICLLAQKYILPGGCLITDIIPIETQGSEYKYRWTQDKLERTLLEFKLILSQKCFDRDVLILRKEKSLSK